MTKSSVLALMPTTKASLQEFVRGAREEFLNGYSEPLEVAIQLKAMEDIIKALRSDPEIKEMIIEEAEKYGKTFEEKGAKFTLKQSVRYEYDDDRINVLKAEIKARETMLKGLIGDMADPETGEILHPAIKKSSDSISITLL